MPTTTQNPVIVFDDAGRVIDANEAAAQLVEIPLPTLRRMHVRDFYHPDELPVVEARMRGMHAGEEVRIERWLRCCNGRYVRASVRVKKRTIGGYRFEYEPLSTETRDLPSRLDGQG